MPRRSKTVRPAIKDTRSGEAVPTLVALRKREAELPRTNRASRMISICNQALVRATDESALMDAICAAIVRKGGFKVAWIGLVEDDPDKTVRPVAKAGADKGYVTKARLPWADNARGQRLTDKAIRTGRPAVCRDIRNDPVFAPRREAALKRGFAASAVLPLRAGKRVFGALSIYAGEAGAFDAAEVRRLSGLADDLAYGIEALRARGERERAETALRRSEKSLQEAQQIARLGNWELDLVGNVLRWSDEIYRIFELDPKEFGASYEAFINAVHPEDRDRVNKAYTDSVRNRMPYDIVHRLLMKDGRIKHVSERCETFYDRAGRPLRSVGTVQDITERHQAAEALRQSDARLNFALETSHVGVWELDLQAHTAFRTLTHDRIFGYEKPLPGWTYEIFLEHVLPEDRPEVDRKFQTAIRSGTGWNFECRIRRADGKVRWIWATGGHELIAGGKPRRMTGLVQDITGRKEAEEALRQAGAYNRRLIEASLDPLVTIGPDGRITDVNTATEAATGRGRAELIGTDFSDYFTEPGKASAGYRLVFREGAVHDYPLELRHRDGHLTSVLYNASVYRDESGRVIGVFAAARDVTMRRQAEALQARLAAIIDSASDAIVSKGLDGIIRTWNPAAERIFGYGAPEVIGRHINLLIPEDRKAEETGILARIRRGELLQHYESVRVRKDGAAIAVSLTVSPIRDVDGRVVAASTIVRDITERQRAEAEIHRLNASLDRRVRERTAELEAANQELESFSYSVSHDLRAPLRSIDGFSRILLEDYRDRLDDEGRDSLARVRAATQRMDRLIDDLLKLSRATRTEMRRTAVDLTALAGEIAAELQAAEPARTVRWEIAPGLAAMGDRQLLRVALDNLLGNAWKFTGRQPAARIEVGTVGTKDGPAFFIRDNGVGFDMAYAGKLFGPFQRLHVAAEFPGTGIGLATVQRIIHRHGGRIWAEGEVNQGATLYFTLPATPPTA